MGHLRNHGKRWKAGSARSALVLLLAGTALLGCGKGDDTSAPVGSSTTAALGPAAAEHRSWVFDAGATGDPTLAGVLVTLYLADGRFDSVESCNDGGGRYEWDGDRLVVRDHMSTLAGCGDEALVGRITGVLGGKPHVAVDAATLTMTTDDGRRVVYVEVADDRTVQQADLTGTWSVFGPGGAGAPAAVALTFDAEGRYQARSGCGNLSGRLAVADGRVTHPEIMGAAAPDCIPGAAPTADEQRISAVLDAAHLRRTDGGLVVLDRAGREVAVLRPAP